MRQRKANLHDARKAYAVFLLMQAPRTADEIADLTECAQTSAMKWFAALEGEGLVSRAAPRHPCGIGCGAHVFTWVGLGDAAKPLP